jgi:hypothetical protein
LGQKIRKGWSTYQVPTGEIDHEKVERFADSLFAHHDNRKDVDLPIKQIQVSFQSLTD